MMSFLKNFLSGEKSPEEKAMLAKAESEKKHDVLTVEAYATDADESEDEEACAPVGGCGGCGCRS